MEKQQERKSTSGISDFFNRIRGFLPWSRDSFGERKPWYKLPLARRIAYFVVSLLLAVLLWGFVLMSQNPDREKTFYNIKPYFETGSESDLIARRLTVYGDPSEILKNVNVTVSAPLTEVSKITADNITATVSLNDVSKAGTYTLKIRATCSVGTVTSIDPETIEVEIDDLVSHAIPISYDFTGELPEGYWHDTPRLLDTTTTVEGAKTDLINISNAVCHISLDGLTESLNSSIPLSVLDSNGNEVDQSVFKSIIPSVMVTMTVLPHKQVPVIYEVAAGDISEDIFEIEEASLNIEYLDIAADEEVLRELTRITSDPIRLTGITEPGSYTFPLTLIGLPEDCYVLGGVNLSSIQLRVVIIEKEIELVLEDVPIRIVGEEEGLYYTYEFTTVNVRISGPARMIQGFLSSDLTVIVNVEGKLLGEHDILLEYTLSDFELFAELEIEILVPTVHVTVAEPPIDR